MAGKTILIADGDRFFVMRLRKLLTGAGHRVIHAYNGNDAVQRFQRSQVDLVIVDIVMPGQGGYETIRQLKAGSPDLKIIVASSVKRDEYFEIARMLGASAAFRKPRSEDDPLPAQEWLETVDRLLSSAINGGER